MYIFPAIDLFEGKAVRLVRGDYEKMTVYSDDPPAFAKEFEEAGAEYLHLVDLEGAKNGETPNFETVRNIVKKTSLKAEIGGGVRSMDVVERYLDAGIYRVILGTAALNDPVFLEKALSRYGSRIAVGVDVRDGYVATHGWLETSGTHCMDFCERLVSLGNGNGIGIIVGVIHHDLAAVSLDHLIYDGGQCGHKLKVKFAFKPLLDDLHVQHTKEAAAEAEAQRHRGFRLEGEGRVVQLQLFQRVTQIGVLAAVLGVDAAVDHGLDGTVAGQGLGSGIGGIGDGVAHTGVLHVLDGSSEIADLAGLQFLAGLHAQRKQVAALDHLIGGPEAIIFTC